MKQPLLSYIVLSYNYQEYIGRTIRSILDQAVQDFEIVVVDDASTDRSCDVIASFGDPRIRLFVNDSNLGGSGSYNRGVSEARGEWLVNLDSDDWIAPEKSAMQLEALARDPGLDIVATHVTFVDAEGAQHPQSETLAAYTNHRLDPNLLENWIGRNLLIRSSTMIRRAAQLRVGLNDLSMTRAGDYELWTRALRHGCRFEIIDRPLTFYRLHSRGATFGDSRGTFRELTYAMLRNLMPLAESHEQWPSLTGIVNWIAGHEELATLSATERHRLVGVAVTQPALCDYSDFLREIGSRRNDISLTEIGRRCSALLLANPVVNKLRLDCEAYVRASDWWREQSKNWEAGSAYWLEQSKRWEAHQNYWREQSRRWEADRAYWYKQCCQWESDCTHWRERAKELETELAHAKQTDALPTAGRLDDATSADQKASGNANKPI